MPSDYQDCERSAHKFEYDHLQTEDQKSGTKLKTLVDLVERNWPVKQLERLRPHLWLASFMTTTAEKMRG